MSGWLLCLAAGLALVANAVGAIRPSALFTDHAVLRRSAATPVFGLADPGERVRVSLGTARAEATADADGKWLVRLNLADIRGDALELRMNDCVARDVAVGEVWLCSGQSNMEFAMGSADDAEAENRVTNRWLRCFVVNSGASASPQREVRGRWLVTEPGSTMRMTAVGYHFAKELQGQLKTPFGIIQSAVGASTIEAWCDPVTMASDPAGKRELDRQIAFMRDYRTYEKNCEVALAAWAKRWNRSDRPHTGVPAEGWRPLEGKELESIQRGPGAVWYRRTVEVDVSKPFRFVRKRFIESQWALDESSVEVYWKGTRLARTFPDDPIEKNTEIYEIPSGSSKGELAVRVFSPERILDVLRYFFDGNVRLDRAGWTTVEEFALPLLTAEMRASQPPRQLQCMRQHWPTGLFNAMIAPLVPVGLSGVIWYQGESNARRADAYGDLFEAMIRSWRTLFRREDLPFAWCQLAAYQGKAKDPAEADDSWPRLRAQQQRALRLPMTGQAVLIDAGEECDIHPRDKRTPGSRLAAWALNRVYGRTEVPFRGPHPTGVVRDGSSVRIEFADVGKGLRAQGLGETYPRRTKVNDYGQVVRNSPQTEVEGFALAGADGVWHWADGAEIDGSGVRVSAKSVPEPLAIRYGWARNPWVNLYNADGFPAEPFNCHLQSDGRDG